MHVLPLPFGLALALMPRREAARLRDDESPRLPFERTVHCRDAIICDPRFFRAAR